MSAKNASGDSSLIGSSQRLMSLLATTSTGNTQAPLTGLIYPPPELPAQRTLVDGLATTSPTMARLDPRPLSQSHG